MMEQITVKKHWLYFLNKKYVAQVGKSKYHKYIATTVQAQELLEYLNQYSGATVDMGTYYKQMMAYKIVKYGR